jgi:hypothetical protein
MAQTSFLNPSRSFPLQAADFLAIEGHVKDTCSALAARLFQKGPKTHSRRREDDLTQVLFFKHATRFACWLTSSLQGRTISHYCQHVLINLPTAVSFVPLWPSLRRLQDVAKDCLRPDIMFMVQIPCAQHDVLCWSAQLVEFRVVAKAAIGLQEHVLL